MPIEHVVACAAGQRVNFGCRVGWVLEVTLALTRFALTVLHTQIEYLTVPPGDVVEFCPIAAVTQSAPGRGERVGEGEGLGDFDGLLDGLGLGDLVGLLDGLLDGLGLGDVVGLFDGLLDGLGLGDLVGLLDGLGLVDELLAMLVLPEVPGPGVRDELRWPPPISIADVTAAVPLLHGEAARCWEASAGAIAKAVTRKDPATTEAETRPARAIRAPTTTLLRAARLRPYIPSISLLTD